MGSHHLLLCMGFGLNNEHIYSLLPLKGTRHLVVSIPPEEAVTPGLGDLFMAKSHIRGHIGPKDSLQALSFLPEISNLAGSPHLLELQFPRW